MAVLNHHHKFYIHRRFLDRKYPHSQVENEVCSMAERTFGSYAFIAGVLIAVVMGIAGTALQGAQIWLTSLLVILGLFVGFFNISRKETRDFLLTCTMLIVAAYAGNASGILINVQFVGVYLSGVFAAVLTFVVPATIMASLKRIWLLGEE